MANDSVSPKPIDDALFELEDRCGYIKRRVNAVLEIIEAGRGRQRAADVEDLIEDTLEELRDLAEHLEMSALATRCGKAGA